MTDLVTKKDGQTSGRLVNQQNMLAEFGVFALNTDDLDAILAKACELVALGLNEPYAKVLETVPGEDRLYLRTAYGFEPTEEERWLQTGRGSSAGHALASGTPTVSQNADADERFDRTRVIARLGVQSLISVPIPDVFVGDGKWYGVMEVDSPREGAFSDDEVAFLRLYTNLIAAAVAQRKALAGMAVALEEKGRLLAELQHRIKNNLAIVTGLIRLQTRQANGTEATEHLDAINRRIETLRLVHERLYARHDTERIHLGPYLNELVDNLLDFYDTPTRNVDVAVAFEDRIVSPDTAIPIGLVVNEFVMNSLKYAFDEGGGTINASLTVENGQSVLILRDDGRGLPANFADRKGTGRTIIAGLSRQIGGKAEWTSENGTALVIRFPGPRT